MTAPTHAGGVVFRESGEEVEVLVVQARRNPNHWVLPKGHIEPGETATDAARREVREETGVSAEILGEVGHTEFELPKESVRTQYFLMRFSGQEMPDEARDTRWCDYAAALDLLSFDDSRTILAEAEKVRRRLSAPDRRDGS